LERKITFPGILKILDTVALKIGALAVKGVAADAEGAEQRTEASSGFGVPIAPGTGFHGAELGKQIAGGEIFRIVFEAEDGTNIGEHLQREAGFSEIEDGSECGASLCRP